jgi:hypothetical protein
MLLYEHREVKVDQMAVFNQNLAINYGEVYILGMAKNESSDGFMDGAAGIPRGREIVGDQVGGHSGAECADIVATEDSSSAERSQFKGFACRHCHRITLDALQEHCLASFSQQMAAVIACTSVDPQPYRHLAVNHGSYRRNAAGQAHIAAGAMGNACACAGKDVNFVAMHVHAVGVPDVVSRPSEFFGVSYRPSAKLLQAKLLFVFGFGQVCMQAHVSACAKASGQRRALAHQIGRNAERATRSQSHATHCKAGGIVIRLYHATAV